MTGDETAAPDDIQSRLQSFLYGDTADERRHRRVVISLPVRFMTEDSIEKRALLYDMSPGGISLTSEDRPEIGARAVLYIDDIGRCEGVVVRYHDYGFALRLVTTQNRRDKIAERLTYHANRHRLRDDDLRMHERYEVNRDTRCILPDGTEMPCRVLDLSLSGAAIAIERRLELGQEVTIGRMQGCVVRHIPQGFAVRFLAAAPSQRAVEDRITGR